MSQKPTTNTVDKLAPALSERVKGYKSAASGLGSAVSTKLTNVLEQSDVGKKAVKAGKKGAGLALDTIKVAQEAGGKVVGTLSGEEIHTRIKEAVDQQRRYNDILATRLAEALDRIEKLEQHVEALSRVR